jgi:hypothetical protein
VTTETIEVRRTGADDYGQWLTAVIAGAPGKGKTPLAITAPNPFFINAEAGTMSIAKDGIPSTEVTSPGQLLRLREILDAGPEVYKDKLGVELIDTVIIDTFDEIVRLVINQRMHDKRQDEMKASDWSWLSDQLNAIIRGFRALPMHVIFVCHVKDQTDGEGRLFYKLDIPGSVAHQLPAAVHVCCLVDDESVSVEDEDGVVTRERRSFAYFKPFEMYEFIKDRSGTLPERMELTFEDDWQRVIHQVFANADSLTRQEVKVIEFDDDVEEVTPVKKAYQKQPAEKKTAEEASAQTEEAARVVAVAKATKAERSSTTEDTDRASEESIADLDNLEVGDKVTLGGNIPNGFQLTSAGKVLEVKGARWVYEVGGTKILSLNELPKGVQPIPDAEVNSGLFCQHTGVEVKANQSNLSRIMCRKVLCEAEFEKETEKNKR